VQVFVPTPLRLRLKVGDSLSLFTSLIVREDSLTLFGFETPAERDTFNNLLLVNGIGPRLALNILSNLTPETIHRAVFQEQAELLSRIPGVGKKTAQKIILFLHDKIKPDFDTAIKHTAASDINMEVMNALVALGYSLVESQKAIQSIPPDTPLEVETRLRLALQSM
jgi:Holliday junction DNA helicase RuvA